MSRRLDCPWPEYPDAWIELPDEWFGEHAERRDRAVEKAQENGLSLTFTQLSIALAILDDWDLPGLNGNPDKWDFSKLSLKLLAWINNAVLDDFAKCWQVPKNSSSPSLNGSTEKEKDKQAPGLLENG